MRAPLLWFRVLLLLLTVVWIPVQAILLVARAPYRDAARLARPTLEPAAVELAAVELAAVELAAVEPAALEPAALEPAAPEPAGHVGKPAARESAGGSAMSERKGELAGPEGDLSSAQLADIQRRLRQWGVNYMRLDAIPGEGPEPVYLFHCRLPVPGSRLYSRPFEARDTRPLAAMRKVLGRIEAWHQRRPQLARR